MKVNNKHLEDRIYEIAKNFIIKNGIHGWNMDKISGEAGITKNTLYKIIGSKEQLLEKCIFNYVMNIHSKIAFILESNKQKIDILRDIIENYPSFINNDFIGKIKEIFKEYPSIEHKTATLMNEPSKKIIAFIKLSIAEGYIRDDLTAEFIFELIRSSIFYFIGNSPMEEFSANVKRVIECIFFGILKR